MKTIIRFYKLVIVSFSVFFFIQAQTNITNTLRSPKAHSLHPQSSTKAWRNPSHISLFGQKSFSKTSTGIVDTAWVRHYASGMIPSSDEATDITVDLTGNVYVTGQSDDEIVTVKYNSNGAVVWVACYNETGNSLEEAAAIAVDASGNVYVTGWGGGYAVLGRIGGHYTTIKYNPLGVQQWVALYDGPGNSTDYAVALALDGSGNVYVTGSSGSDYGTIKYNSNGDSIWVARYNGGDATAMAVDASGNVYVMGKDWSLKEFAIVKYNSAGVKQWVAHVNGEAVCVDSSGNVYVTGSDGTIKYNSNGVQQWIKNYCSNAITVDGSGDVYLSGTSGGTYTTVKYNSNGNSLWIAQFNGPVKSSNEATAFSLDASGNIFITGTCWHFVLNSETGIEKRDYCTVKYNSAGVPQWSILYDGTKKSNDVASDFAIDSSGNIYITGISKDSVNLDYATVKYNTAGVQQWVARYDSVQWNLSNTGVPACLAVDAYGNVYVTGTNSDTGTGNDFVTIKYNLEGIQQWLARYREQGKLFNCAGSIAVDAFGNVCVAGTSYDTAWNSEWSTVKYNSSGDLQWVAHFTGGSLNDVTVDASGNVYVVGSSDDFVTIKYNSNGDTLWVARYNGLRNFSDFAAALTVDASGNVYVTGRSGSDYATIKYNTAGIQQWVARDNGGGADLVVDVSGNVYVTGNGGTVKYNSNGVKQWATNQGANALTVDAFGNVYVATTSDFIWGSSQGDYKTIKYNPAGVEQWVESYDSPGKNTDLPVDIAVDRTGNVYVAGTSVLRFTSSDVGNYIHNSVFTTIKYIQTPTSVNQYSHSTPDVFALEQNYPNPFNPSTTLRYNIPERSTVRLSIFNTLGQRISEIVNETNDAGSYEQSFNASQLSSGIYFYRIEATSTLNSGRTFVETKKMILMR